jgi:hypothetical protein
MLRLSTKLGAEILSVHLTILYTSKNESDLFLQPKKKAILLLLELEAELL